MGLSLPKAKFSLEFSERKLLLCVADIILIASGNICAMGYWIYQAGRLFEGEIVSQNLWWMITISISWLIWMFSNDLYDLRITAQLPRTIRRIGIGGIVMSGIYLVYYLIATSLLLGEESFSLRLTPMVAIIGTSLLVSIWRTIYTVFLSSGSTSQRLLIVGAGVTGEMLAAAIAPYSDYEVVGFIDDNRELHGQKIGLEIPVLGGRQNLQPEIDRSGVNEIILAISQPIDDDLLQILTDCYERGVVITPMPVLYQQVTGKVAVEHIGSQWYSALPFHRNPFETFNRIGKRGFDLVCGVIIGLILAVVFPFVAIAIKLDSPGAIFYQQERVGQHGVRFTVYKFRSMVQNAERNGQAQWSVQGDARITKIGNFIRKTRLDELPQAINVLRGEMSMVGPRPERHQFIQELQQQIPFYRTRLAVKPGLTGWAQVNYGYGSTVEDALIKLQYDLYYLKHWSPWLDFKILLRTFAVVLKMQGQ
jgi:exopolysaccharide biosynthesis polyprenyl glycosylphosphotransferase